MNDLKILELIAARPGIKAVEIANHFNEAEFLANFIIAQRQREAA